jgi:hypothetical protein
MKDPLLDKKIKKKERKKEKKRKKVTMVNDNTINGKRKNPILQSIKQNYIFYFTIMLCIYAFSYKRDKLVTLIFSFLFITFYGYFVHMVSHDWDTHMSDSYKTFDNVFTRNKYLNWLIIKAINFSEFHAKTHHDSEINKTKINIALEFFNNIMTQGGLLIFFKYFFNLIDNRIILLWALFYATVHNINYNIVSPQTHRQHHVNDKTNYGIDIWDIIMGTKFDYDTIETHNHASINLLLITALILFFTK